MEQIITNSEHKFLADYPLSYSQEQSLHSQLETYRQMIEDGHLVGSTRGTESYSLKLSNGKRVYQVINCLGHALNFRNQQIIDYGLSDYRTFGFFPDLIHKTNQQQMQDVFDFFREIGLKVEECDQTQSITDYRSSKIACYTSDIDERHSDLHFFLEEAPHIWSGKIGFGPYIEFFRTDKLPIRYQNPTAKSKIIYDYVGTYRITNPKADMNNVYVKGVTSRKKSIINIQQNHMLIKCKVGAVQPTPQSPLICK